MVQINLPDNSKVRKGKYFGKKATIKDIEDKNNNGI